MVRFLTDADRLAEAEQWVFRGIKNLGGRLPGVAGDLRAQLLDIRKKEKDWPAVAAQQVYEFVVYLRKIARVLKDQKKGQEWEGYLKGLRQTHARKSSLLAVLDTLEGKPILTS